jgi:pimeloyl-ACP methyl ester carboxylesterase
MEKIISKDGTDIAFDRFGHGPAVVLVVGAFNDRSTGAPLAEVLASRFAVLSYDRRGRGASGDRSPYAIAREIEDLEAVIGAAGGSASIVGYSSGAVLAMKAAAQGLPIPRLALYDTPPPQPASHAAELAALVASGRRGDAVEYFQRRLVGIPEEVILQLRHAPFRRALEAMAHTLVYDATIMGEAALSPEETAAVRMPTLAIAGGAGAPIMHDVAEALARTLPNARTLKLEGATHDIAPGMLGPVLEAFFS